MRYRRNHCDAGKQSYEHIIPMNSEKDDPEPQESEKRKPLLQRLAALIPFGKPETKEDLENEILELLEEGGEQGLIGSLEEKMINSIFDFRETKAVEIMTPAIEILSVDVSIPLDILIDMVIDSGFTRVPVYRGSRDQIIGLVHAKDLLKICARPHNVPFNLEEYLLPVYFIPESKLIIDLFREFQIRKAHMAIVMDEFGAVRGLITMEDIIEEIVGEIDDEYDDEQDQIERLSGNSIIVQAMVNYEVVEEFFDLKLPEGPYESVGGLLIHLLGRLGKVGDRVEVGNLVFEIKSASRRRIKMVQIERKQQEEQEE